MTREISIVIDGGGRSSTISMSTTSAQTPASETGEGVLYVSTGAFVRSGADPTAVSTGADQYLYGPQQYRVKFGAGHKLALILAADTGTAYFTPGAV